MDSTASPPPYHHHSRSESPFLTKSASQLANLQLHSLCTSYCYSRLCPIQERPRPVSPIGLKCPMSLVACVPSPTSSTMDDDDGGRLERIG
ncbi:hypothetical protein RchiOBHm_Chr6g0297131 [Rosa chinensis]|uniref:Uncharacterized protein n=1 Tax=Rosa chinensis TaxID=74649 RepID=A0A2P6PXK8_ROSCH|nr:hypothetical protein RchiOBHm_Chr6g0297131 [Rosa chinensis]